MVQLEDCYSAIKFAEQLLTSNTVASCILKLQEFCVITSLSNSLMMTPVFHPTRLGSRKSVDVVRILSKLPAYTVDDVIPKIQYPISTPPRHFD